MLCIDISVLINKPLNQEEITLSKNSNPCLCNSQVLPPTSITIANVCPSPGTSTIPHSTPASLSTRTNSRLTSIETILSSSPCTTKVGGNHFFTLSTGSISLRTSGSGQHAWITVPLAICVKAKASRGREKSGPALWPVSLWPSRETLLLIGIGTWV